MATQSQFVAQPVLEYAVIGTADTAATAATAIATVATGPAVAAGSGVGKRISRVSVNIPGTSTSIMFSTTVSGLVGLMLPGGTGASANLLRATSTVNTGVQIVCESGTL